MPSTETEGDLVPFDTTTGIVMRGSCACGANTFEVAAGARIAPTKRVSRLVENAALALAEREGYSIGKAGDHDRLRMLLLPDGCGRS